MRIRIIAGVIVMASIINLAACVPDREEREKQAARMLEEKYGEEFEVIEILEEKHMEQTYEVLAAAKEHMDVLFEAKAAMDASWLSDEYIASRVCQKIEDQILQKMEWESGYVLLKVQSVGKTIDSTEEDMPPEEFAEKKPGNKFVIYVACCPGNMGKGDIYQAIKRGLEGLSYLNGSIQLCVTDEETLRKVQEYLDSHAKVYYEYDRILEGFPKWVLRFSNGTLQLTETEFVDMAGEEI